MRPSRLIVYVNGSIRSSSHPFWEETISRHVVSPCNIFLIFSSLEANLQQKEKKKERKIKGCKAKFKSIAKQSCHALYPLAHRRREISYWSSLLVNFEWASHQGCTWLERYSLSQCLPLGPTWKRPPSSRRNCSRSATSQLHDLRGVSFTHRVLRNLSVHGKWVEL